jgi:hypothetical protein
MILFLHFFLFALQHNFSRLYEKVLYTRIIFFLVDSFPMFANSDVQQKP